MSQYQSPFRIADVAVPAGGRAVVDLPISNLSNRLPMSLSVQVIHGRRPGPTMFVSAAIHGDEIVGVEILRRLIRRPALDKIKGTLLVVPVVNGFGFLNHSRYLPDRRDLNRCFPGSATGPLAHRLAYLFLEQIVRRADFGIDIHSASIHRSNLPQIRIHEKDDNILTLAKAFGAPVVMTAPLREGSLRQSALDIGVPVLLFEGGEGLRFDETVVRSGLSGVLRVMRHVGMIDGHGVSLNKQEPFVSSHGIWARAPAGGLLRLGKTLGDPVRKDEPIGSLNDLFGEQERDLISPCDGIIVGRTNLPIVNEGDAVLHIAKTPKVKTAAGVVESIVDQLERSEMFYEDEII